MYLRIRPLGGQTTGPEVWTVAPSYRWVPFTATFTQAALQSLANRLIANIGTATFGSLRALMSSTGTITGWRVEQWDEQDNLQAAAEASYGTAMAGTGGATKTLQDSVVLSLRTNTPGPRGRGRLYWPAWGAATSNWRLSTPSAATVAADARTLLLAIQTEITNEAVANLISDLPQLAVRSRTTHSSLQVVSIVVGDVLDTQRRRRESLAENRSAVTY